MTRDTQAGPAFITPMCVVIGGDRTHGKGDGGSLIYLPSPRTHAFTRECSIIPGRFWKIPVLEV